MMSRWQRCATCRQSFPQYVSSLPRASRRRSHGRARAVSTMIRFERSGLPLHHLIVNDWRPFIEELIESERLEALSFLDLAKTRVYVREVLEKPDPGYNPFVAVLACVDQFLKQVA